MIWPEGYRSAWQDAEIDALRELAAQFIRQHVVDKREKIYAQRHVDRELWTEAGKLGLLCCSIPVEYGGGGGSFAHELAVVHEQGWAGDTAWGNSVHSGIVAHYILAYGTEQQRQTWLPKMATGELVGAVAMTEPGTGSDLQAVATRAIRDGDEYVINGAKTFISNGSQAGLIILVARTSDERGSRGISLIGVETEGLTGFSRGRILEKIGQHGADTSELFFDDVRVPAVNVLGGTEGNGFIQLMQQLAQERLLIGVSSVAAMERAVEEAVSYAKERTAFGKALLDYQNTRFVLAEAATKAHAARVFIDSCIERHLAGRLDATTAAMCKWWLTEQANDVIDKCLQVFGGYGYMSEYPIARLFNDARVQKIYGGTNEIMKELIARSF